jgi:hypothetical protein
MSICLFIVSNGLKQPFNQKQPYIEWTNHQQPYIDSAQLHDVTAISDDARRSKYHCVMQACDRRKTCVKIDGIVTQQCSVTDDSWVLQTCVVV